MNDFDRYKEKADELGSDASDAYHEHVPKNKRPFFWGVVIIGILVVLTVLVKCVG